MRLVLKQKLFFLISLKLGFNPIIFIITPVLFSLSFTTDVTIDIKGSGIINIIIIVIIKSTIGRAKNPNSRLGQLKNIYNIYFFLMLSRVGHNFYGLSKIKTIILEKNILNKMM